PSHLLSETKDSTNCSNSTLKTAIEKPRKSPRCTGRTEYNDRWTDWSRTAVERRTKKRRDYLDRLRVFLAANLSEQDKLSARVLQYLLARELDTETLDVYILRITQLFGVHNNIYRTIDAMPHNTLRDYENIIKRLEAVPVYVDQNIAIFNDAISHGLVQPT